MQYDITCPISKHIFKEPAIASDGYIYEKECIEQWLKIKHTSPMTNQPLAHGELSDVQFMKNIINDMIKKDPNLVKEQYSGEQNLSKEELYEHIIYKNKLEKILQLKDIDISLLIGILEKHKCYSEDMRNFFKKQTKIINHIIDNCIDINSVIIDGWRLIHYICWAPASQETVKHIIDKGADLEVETSRGLKPIYLLIKYSTSDAVKYFLNKNPTVNNINCAETECTCEYVNNKQDVATLILKKHNLDIIKYAFNKKIIKTDNEDILTCLFKNPHILETVKSKKNFIKNLLKLLS